MFIAYLATNLIWQWVVVWLMNQLSLAQEEDTAIVSDTTEDLWILTEGESEQVSVEMKEAALEEGSGGEEGSLDDDYGGKEEKSDKEVMEHSL